MQFSEDTKKTILSRLLERIAGIASREYQIRVWINGIGPEVDDFDETCIYFFNDSDCVIENFKTFKITNIQKNILIEFRNAFRKFSDENYSPIEFIDTIDWDKITKMAEEVLQAFNYTQRLQ